MVFNIRMYAAADRYMVAFLKDLTRNKLKLILNWLDDNTEGMLEFLDIIPFIYTNAPDQTLRGLLPPVIRRFRSSLHSNREWMALLRSGLADGDFAIDAFAALINLPNPSKSYCGDCKTGGARRMRCKKCEKLLGYREEHQLDD